MEKVTFTPNVPQQVALRFPDGKLVEGRFGDQVLFTLVDGRAMYLDTAVAAKINQLGIQKGERFHICKRWSGKKGDQMQWDVYQLEGSAASQPIPADKSGLPESDIEREVRAEVMARLATQQVEKQARASAGTPAPATTAATQPPHCNGNGTKPNGGLPNSNGNATHNTAKPPYSTAGPSVPPTKVGYDLALRRLLRTTIAALKDAGEQWSDSARQDLISTLMIQAARDGAVSWAPLTREEN